MASIALHLKSHHLKPSQTLLKSTSFNLTFSHLFSSSSSSSSNNNNNGGNTPDKQYPFSAQISEITSKLKDHNDLRQYQQQGSRQSNYRFPQGGSSNPSKSSIDEIRKNMSEFRLRSSGSTSETPPPQQHIGNVGNPNPNPNISREKKTLSFEDIRVSLRNVKKSGDKGNNLSLNNFTNNLKMRPTMEERGGNNRVYGGSFENLPAGVFGKEIEEKEAKKGKEEGGGGGSGEDDMELVAYYTHEDLGKKLKELRPEIKGKKAGKENWFSLSELGERLKKLKKKEIEKSGSAPFADVRRIIKTIKSDDKKSGVTPIQTINILSPSSFTTSPPQEHLVEKYFHPDNMCAEEKLKLELKRVRDEFKMHESDCGSTRVQIAQLTTEILHLSSVLHKKDKHSRRGLLAKVQQRKKLLKYLRRTDWESYTFVLSKLGLRDNPDYKN